MTTNGDIFASLYKKLSRNQRTESSLYFVLLREWLQECDESHYCKRSAQFWPTRVIFVGDFGSPVLNLWEMKCEQYKPSNRDGYIALSHCWGRPEREDQKGFCTNSENYRHRLDRFSEDDLPKTFKKLLKLHDEEDSDWNNEAGPMVQVFGSAYCIITTSSTRNWKEGFLERESTPRFRYHCDNKIDIGEFKADVDAGLLNGRAWVLQERVLSRRTIHLLKITYIGSVVMVPRRKEYFLLDPEFPERLSSSGYHSTITFIQFLFEKYAQSGLSKKSDREIAISGLVKRMETVFKNEYRHGIFADCLSRLLLWRRVPVHTNLQFNNDQGGLLLVQVWTFRNCRTERQMSPPVILDTDLKDVGFCWFDRTTNIHFQHCVVIGMRKDTEEDAEKAYYILLVRKASLENQYERVVLGKIKARCVSKEYCKGELS
ncbi:hypothetical protein K469DRAFT_725092 [Zopfia rhizophila CBS 207.26]|uniref:Uncharacterized protein n=1 Tax=Zopfia rhizophila CBS 207.26 TaxID=1314779 RepID=A0A6A6D6R0_9PEZI|nr:hypothetical protein K469DRAFT_725092 [Zopfia rhizophila CBS 207.26]